MEAELVETEAATADVTVTLETRVRDLETACAVLLMLAICGLTKAKYDKADMLTDLNDSAATVVYNQSHAGA